MHIVYLSSVYGCSSHLFPNSIEGKAIIDGRRETRKSESISGLDYPEGVENKSPELSFWLAGFLFPFCDSPPCPPNKDPYYPAFE